ncbi:MAG TPA: insulinase family protein, partial [Gemmatimonadaceae bacterium]|nr:insulinase family protein [Gemmatimonadaceae bacterium]
MPPFTRSRLPNGVEVIVAPFKRLPVATIRVVVDAGATRDTPGREGESFLTAKSLVEGTRQRSADEITAAIERLGGELDSQTDWNDLSVSTTIQSAAVAEALDVVGELVRTPVFPEAGVARNRNEQLSEREQARLEPRQHADDVFASVVYDPKARFALPEAG